MKQFFQPQKYIIFFNWQRKHIYFAAKKRRRQIRASGLRLPSILRQLWAGKRMATHYGSHLPMYQALASISGDDQIFRATEESIFFHLTTFGDGDAREVGTITECTIPNIRYRWGDGNACKAGATREKTKSDYFYRWRDGDACKVGATRESTIPNLNYRWRDGDACEAGTTVESTFPNHRY